MFTNASVSGSQEEGGRDGKEEKEEEEMVEEGLLDVKPCGNATNFLPSDNNNSGLACGKQNMLIV